MEDFVKRIIDEQKEVQEFLDKTEDRQNKLRLFIYNNSNKKYDNLSREEKFLLNEQFDIIYKLLNNLEKYNTILLIRSRMYKEK